MKKFILAALALSAVFTAPASAITVVGTTVGGPVFNRPLTGTPVVELSGVGTAVRYQVTRFTVGTTGSYSFLMTGTNPVNWDTFLGLHANAFNPIAPLTNGIIYNDDFPSIGLSGFNATLTSGVSYFAIATGFENIDFGAYSLAINGPGTITIGGGQGGAVPEPATWAMMLAGFGIVGGVMRRRRHSLLSFA